MTGAQFRERVIEAYSNEDIYDQLHLYSLGSEIDYDATLAA
jgi:hypothetical protein